MSKNIPPMSGKIIKPPKTPKRKPTTTLSGSVVRPPKPPKSKPATTLSGNVIRPPKSPKSTIITASLALLTLGVIGGLIKNKTDKKD